jgi:ATP-dependent RNA helicase DeaD
MERRGFTALTAVQRAVLEADARGANFRISSQTGSGKTVAIGMALADELIETFTAHVSAGTRAAGPLALFVCPTRELAAQVRSELSWLFAEVPRMVIGVVTGGTDIGRERKLLSRRPAILVGTPGRLLDHVRASALKFTDLQHVVLDEADQMLDMGFRDELDAIVDALPETRRGHLVSATFPAAVRRFANRFAPDALQIEGTKLGAANADIEHVVHLVRERDHYAALVNTLLLVQGARCLVFVRRRAEASEVAERLAGDGFSALPFSGDLAQAQRTRTLNAFRNGIVRTLVATDVAARGIDVADIGTVIHLDLPHDATVYTHRSGRTGRAGQKGRSMLLVTPRAESRMRRMFSQAKIEAEWSTLPNAAKIKKSLTKRARRQVHDTMTSEGELTNAQREYAERLLAQYDPVTLISRLLVLAEPELPREPMDLKAPVRNERGERGEHDDRPPRDPGAFIVFTLAWGHRKSATPARVLAQICRRGQISSRLVGALDVGPDETLLEIARDSADAFEAAVAEAARAAEAKDDPDARPDSPLTRGGGPIERRPRPRGPRGGHFNDTRRSGGGDPRGQRRSHEGHHGHGGPRHQKGRFQRRG